MSARALSLPGSDSEFVHLLGAISSVANESSDVADAVKSALERVAEFTGWPIGQAFTIDAAGTAHSWLSSHVSEARLVTFEQASSRLVLPAGVGLPGRVVAGGSSAWVMDVLDDPNFPRADAAREAGLHGAFAFPITAGGTVVAVMEFFSDEPVEPGDGLLDAVEQLGMQLGRVFERQQAQDALATAALRLRQILNSAGEAFIGMDTAGKVTEWNREAEQVFGWSREEALGRRVSELVIPEEYRELHERGVSRFLASGRPKVLGQRLELEGLNRSGDRFPIELTLWALKENDSWSFYSFARDITARKQAEAELARDALHDALTGLANRTALHTRMEHALSRMTRGLVPPAVLFIDLDRFKPVNDTFGHDVGDRVLMTVAE